MPHKKLAVIGQPGHIHFSYDYTSLELFKKCGLNTGNLAFWHAIDSHIDGDKEYLGWDVEPAYVKKNFDALIFPAANQLNPDWDMGILANLFEKADVPIFICGLGVQAKDKTQALTFKPGSKRFMHVLSERAVKIGVRGEYTAQVLQENGVDNIEVLGCPSNFLSSDPRLGMVMEEKFKMLSNIQNIVMNLDITESLQSLMRTAFKWGSGRNAVYINQAPEAIVRMSGEEFNEVEEGTVGRINNVLCPQLPRDEFKKFVRSNFKSFFSASEWMSQLRNADLSVGSRMHGNMLAWQVKTPSILFPHDSRTTELCELMKLPYIASQKIAVDLPLEALLSQVRFNGHEYDGRRAELLGRYSSLIVESNLKQTARLTTLNEKLNGGKGAVAA